MGMAKELLKKVLLSTGYELKKNNPLVAPHNQAQIIENFITLGSIPWSEGYIQYKEQEILKVLNDKTVMQEFVSDINLSAKFGFGLDERIIEYPWFFSQVANFESLANYYLDAGPVMNHEFLVERASKLAHTVHFTTLNHEDNCYQELDISYLFSDLVNLPIKNEFYDLISCISTLEHIGCNNACYGDLDSSLLNQKNYAYLDAAKELLRVLKPKGSLYITIPFGRYMHLGMLQQFDNGMLDRLLGVFDGLAKKCDFFKYLDSGWQKSDRESCQDETFVEWLPSSLMNKAFPVPHPVETDKAAAARSICCIRVTKG